MARRGRGWWLPVAILVAVAAAAWYGRDSLRPAPATPSGPVAPVSAAGEVAADRVDPRNEGRRVRVAGGLRPAAPVRDPQFGISVDALALERTVEMLQWVEDCTGGACRHRLEWSARPVDSRGFREPRGHENPTAFPFESRRFVADDLRLGAFGVHARAAAQVAARSDHPVRVANLPPNLAASLRDCDRMLCSGSPGRPAAGDLRIHWRIVPPARVALAGTQRGNRLEPDR